MSRSASFATGATEHHGPTWVGIAHHPELVEVSQAGSHWHNPGRLDIPLQMHELPHEVRERHAAGEAGGRPIDVATDPRIPSHVYHVTTNKPAVLKEGLLRASGGSEGGLGGHHARVVSMTTDRRTAMQIHKDLKFAGETAQKFGSTQPEPYDTPERAEWGRGLVKHLQGQAHKEGWEWEGAISEHQLSSYGLSDWMNHYHSARSRLHPQREQVRTDPVLIGPGWQGMDPSKVGVVRVPKANIARTGALVTDFDLRQSLARQGRPPKYPGEGQHGHFEIRVHGDVPL